MESANEKFDQIKMLYNSFYNSLLSEGKLPMRNTVKGFWGTTSVNTIYEFFKKIELQKFNSFLDLGSGDGVVVLVASLFTSATGIEIDDELYEKSIEFRNKLKLKTNLINGDFMNFDLSSFDIIFINPDKSFSYEFENKLLRLKGTLFVYNNIFLPKLLKKEKTFWIEQMPVVSYRGR